MWGKRRGVRRRGRESESERKGCPNCKRGKKAKDRSNISFRTNHINAPAQISLLLKHGHTDYILDAPTTS
jgi:glutaredoxin